ncbi:MAG TPA: cyanophycinase [Chitinophagaceae bacterium]|nr:cyanophycinase [Chitinophagaceae bacterium]
MVPKGTILIIGGAEDTGDGEKSQMKEKNEQFEDLEILRGLLPRKAGKRRIEIVTTASHTPEKLKRRYKQAFKKLGYAEIGFLVIEDKMQARNQRICARIKKSHAVFFAGGDQFRISAVLGGTTCADTIKDKYLRDEDFVVAGTSAGAMALPDIMIYEGGVEESLMKDDLRVTSGLGFLRDCIVDTHFIKRGRFGRLAHAVVINPECLGIGLGEDAALKIEKGEIATCHGSGSVIIIDGNQIGQTNVGEVDEKTPIFVENLRVHLLAKDIKFSLKGRRLVVPKKPGRKPKQ